MQTTTHFTAVLFLTGLSWSVCEPDRLTEPATRLVSAAAAKTASVLERSSYVYTTKQEVVDYLTQREGYEVLDTECYVFTDPTAAPDLIPVYRYSKRPVHYRQLPGRAKVEMFNYSADTYYSTTKTKALQDQLDKEFYFYQGIDFYVRRSKVYVGEKPKEKDKWGVLYRMWSDKEGVLNHYYTRVEVRTKRKKRGYRDDGFLGGVILKPDNSPVFSKATPLYKLVRHF